MTLLLAAMLFAAPADTLTLREVYRDAAEHYPRAREAGIARTVTDLRVRNLRTRYLPSLSLGGQAVYQSDVPSIPLSVPGMSPIEISKDQYRAGLSVEQMVWDGGVTAARIAAERSAGAVSEQEIAVATYGIREQVEGAYFAVLLSEAERASLDVLAEDLRARLEQARSLVRRGAATASNAETLEAELIRIGQQRDAADSRRRAAFDVLEEMTGRTIADGTVLAVPDPGPATAGTRPELALYELSRRRLDDQARLESRSTRPKITTFVDAAVGRPQGLNMFENEFGPFVSLGVRVAWPFWDWKNSERDREALSLQSDAVSAREDAFLQATRSAAAGARREIERLESHLDGDAEIVSLRARVSAESRSRFDNGVITAADYLVDRNAEHRARLAERVHRIQLAQARARLVTILGAS